MGRIRHSPATVTSPRRDVGGAGSPVAGPAVVLEPSRERTGTTVRDPNPTPSYRPRRGTSIPRRFAALVAIGAISLAGCTAAAAPTPTAAPTPAPAGAAAHRQPLPGEHGDRLRSRGREPNGGRHRRRRLPGRGRGTAGRRVVPRRGHGAARQPRARPGAGPRQRR